MKKLFTRRPKTQNSDTVQSSKASFAFPLVLMIFVGTALFAYSGIFWYKNVLTNPDRLLNDVLNKSLQTSSVNRTVEQTSRQGSVKQDYYLSFTPKVVADSTTTLEEVSSAGKTNVVTDSIGTNQADYVRYSDISVQSGKQLDLNNVLGVWGKRNNDAASGQSSSFLNDALFLVVPFGNLNESQRKEVIAEAQKTELYKQTESKLSYANGRPVMSYSLSVDPKSLVQVLAKYVEVTGVGSDAQLDPSSYEGASAVQIKLDVDVLSKHVNTVEFVDSGRKETYHAYNFDRSVAIPDQAVPVDELQQRLQSVQQQLQ